VNDNASTSPTSASREWPVAIVGAGPVGLAAAARLIERGIEPIVIEAGASVGANLLDYGHVRLFSPWRYNVDPAMAAQLQASGWHAPAAEALPLARDVVERVLQPYAELPEVARALHLGTKVVAISREGLGQGQDERPRRGALHHPRRAAGPRHRVPGPGGDRRQRHLDHAQPARRQWPAGRRRGRERRRHLLRHPGRARARAPRYAGKRTLVVGAGHSAANALLALAELAQSAPGTRLVWAVRSPVPTRVFGGGDADALPARGELGSALAALRDSRALAFVAGLSITAVRRERGTLSVEGLSPEGKDVRLTGIDEIVCATAQRPDLAALRELRLKLDPWLESTEALGPLIDPNLHSCGTVRPHGHRELAHPEKGFYTLGVKSYGRAPTFLMATGFEQARSVAAAIAGDLEAADRVELDLPETGVCSAGTASPADRAGAAGSTAAPPAPAVPRRSLAPDDVAADPRRLVGLVEGEPPLAQGEVGGGGAVEAPQVLGPGLVDDLLDEALRRADVVQQLPADGALAQPCPPRLLQHLHERLGARRDR
jgi:hypothetical protein